MKKYYLLLCMLCFIAVSVSSQNLQDVVYLKNGSVIRGDIIEQIPNQTLKIKTKDGSVFVYKMTEVEKMTKEQAANSYSGNTSNNCSGYQSKTIIPSYKQIRINYDPSLYNSQPGEPYNPIVSGVCSLLIPGLGQIICGETNRGLGYLGGYVGGVLFVGLGVTLEGSYGSSDVKNFGKTIKFIGAAGCFGTIIMSAIDAFKIAKVKDMYFNDMRSKTSSFRLEISPYIDQISMNKEIVRPIGVKMSIKF